jgi:replicative DNA helicase
MTFAAEVSRGVKPPPEKPEAEASLLGAMLLDGSLYNEVARARLAPPDLSREQHRIVLAAIARVADRAEQIGYGTVQAELAARDELDAVGGSQFLVGLMQNVPTVAHAGSYAAIVERTALLRRLIGAANEIARLALTREDSAAAVGDAQELLFTVSESTLHRDIVPLEVALHRYAEQIDARGDLRIGIRTGLDSIDKKTGGLQGSDLILVAGRPGLGKTSFALNVIEHAAITERKTCAIFSLEMSEMQVVQRLVSMRAEIDGNRMRRGRLSPQEFTAISAASSELQQAPIYVEESSRLTVTDILAKSRRLQAERGLDLVIIDYLQLIEGAEDDESRVLEVARISRALKAIARELEVPVMALSQLSRQIEQRGTEPMLSDLRECVTGDTTVVDAESGRRIKVAALQPGARILAVGPWQEIGAYTVADVWPTGIKPVFRLRTQTGREIRATANHPFMTGSGWRSLETLRRGDVIATARRLPAHGRELSERANRCRLLGYIAGDGTYQRHRGLGFISSDDEAFWDVLRIVDSEFPGVTPRFKKSTGPTWKEADFVRLYDNGYGRPYGNPMREWLREIGVFGQQDSTKRVADFVFEAGNIGALNFLAGYLATDGSVKVRISKPNQKRWAVHFDSVSRDLLVDVQHLLLRVGVVATIGRPMWNTKSTQPIFRMQLSEVADNLRLFSRLVSVVGRKGELLAEMRPHLSTRETSPGLFALTRELSAHVRHLGVGWKDQHKRMHRGTALRYALETSDPILAEYVCGDLLWEEIVAIEPTGEEATFDLRVPETGNFLANGIVVHNSGALEADADLVMFLWQKDRKDRDEGVVRLKLAKHRNGPTGDFDLHFQSELTRFRDLGETREGA